MWMMGRPKFRPALKECFSIHLEPEDTLIQEVEVEPDLSVYA